MIKSKFFIRYVALAVFVAVAFLALSIFTTNWIRRLTFDETIRGGPFIVFESLLERLTPQQRIEALQETDVPRSGGPPPDGGPVRLADINGNILYPLEQSAENREEIKSLVAEAKREDRFLFFSAPFRVRKLSGEPAQFVVVRLGGPGGGSSRDFRFLMMNSAQIVAMVGAVVVTILVLVYSIRSRAKVAEQVISEITHGNLKARLPVSKMDEVGHFMEAFNKMADEIERLVEDLRKMETVRRDLLRELAHDLRTPIASMKTLIETARDQDGVLKTEQRHEVLDLAAKEADYFEGLVDDLLFLGKVSEPRYRTQKTKVDISSLIEEELEPVRHRYANVKFNMDAQPEVYVEGDPSLLRRLVRNGIENAASFANAEAKITLRREGKNVIVSLLDDGPGFSQNALQTFGQRKFSRALPERKNRRISIGLGSVIMKSVAEAHRGQVIATNRKKSDDSVAGADVSIVLPSFA